MRNIEYSIRSDNECLPSWYRSEHYEYCDSMYDTAYKAVRVSFFQRIIEFLLIETSVVLE